MKLTYFVVTNEGVVATNEAENALEISTKSRGIGMKYSAFCLDVRYRLNGEDRLTKLENVFQSSKVFEFGGAFREILLMTPVQAKTFLRRRNLGKLVGFNLGGKDFPIEPKTLFYDWIYIQTLLSNNMLEGEIMNYRAFVDSYWNSRYQVNCQAKSLALAIFLKNNGLLEDAMSSVERFSEYLNRYSKTTY